MKSDEFITFHHFSSLFIFVTFFDSKYFWFSSFLNTDYPKSCTVDGARGKVIALKKACGMHLEKGIVCICT